MLSNLAALPRVALALAKNPVVRKGVRMILTDIALSAAVVATTDAVRKFRRRNAPKEEVLPEPASSAPEKVARYVAGTVVEAIGLNTGVYVVAPAVAFTAAVSAVTALVATPMDMMDLLGQPVPSGGWQRLMVRWMAKNLVIPAYELGDRLTLIGQATKGSLPPLIASSTELLNAIIEDPDRIAARMAIMALRDGHPEDEMLSAMHYLAQLSDKAGVPVACFDQFCDRFWVYWLEGREAMASAD